MRKKPGPQPDPKYGYRRNIAGYKHGRRFNDGNNLGFIARTVFIESFT